MIKGIDVSRWQGVINWPLVARNVGFAIIKIGGSDQGFYPDGQAVRNALEARANSIPVGFYVYLGGAASVKDEVAHIKNLINSIGGLRPGEFIALDWEENHPNEVEYVAGIAKGLIDAGVNPPVIYMSLSYVRRQNWSALTSLNCALWVAAWGNNDDQPDTAPPSDEWPHWAIWQYSSTGTVPGISGRVDMNLFNGTIDQFKAHGGSRAVTMPTTVNASRVVIADNVEEYTVVRGDSLSAIAARFGRSWQDLWNLNRDRVSNPNMIFPGLKLRVWQGNKPAAPAQPQDNNRYHVVASGETLSGIAQRYNLPSYILLWEANKDIIGNNPNFIKPGQRLRIP